MNHRLESYSTRRNVEYEGRGVDDPVMLELKKPSVEPGLRKAHMKHDLAGLRPPGRQRHRVNMGVAKIALVKDHGMSKRA